MSITKIKKQRTRETFDEKMKSQAQNTRDLNSTALNNFEKFAKEKYQSDDIAAELKLADEDQVFEILQEWINWNSSIHPATLDNYWGKTKQYLHYRGIKLHPLDIKQELTFPHKIQEDYYGLKREDIQKLFKGLKYKYQLLFTCQSSSLMRIGELLQLKKKYLITESDEGIIYKTIIVKLPAHITKLKKSRTTFFSTEASKMLRPRLKELGDDDLIFTTQKFARFAVSTIEQVMRRALIRVRLDQRYESNGQYKINTHSFRAYGITKLSRHDDNFAKIIAGHVGYKLGYDRLDDIEKLEVYQKYEDSLLIDDTAVKKADNERLKKENMQLQKLSKVSPELIDKMVSLMEQYDTKKLQTTNDHSD